MKTYCELCGDGIFFVLENCKPTITELNNFIQTIETYGKYIECGESREIC